MKCEFTGERVYPGMTKPLDILKIWHGETKLPPQATWRLWQEHCGRYEFAKDFCAGKNVLDIACGTGYGCRILNTSKYTGVDIDFPTIRKAYDKYNTDGSFVAADALSLPFNPHSFDVVVSFETIEHLPIKSLPHFLKNVTRLLVDDGVFIISTPNRDLSNPGTSADDYPKNTYHMFELAPDELVDILKPHFEKISLFGQGLMNSGASSKRTVLRRAKTLKKLATGELSRVVPLSENNKKVIPTYIVVVCEQLQKEGI